MYTAIDNIFTKIIIIINEKRERERDREIVQGHFFSNVSKSKLADGKLRINFEKMKNQDS